MRRPTRRSDIVELIAPTDPAIDVNASGETLATYARREHTEWSRLTIRAGAVPVRYEVRGLSELELTRARAAAGIVGELDDEAAALAAVSLYVWVVRLGVVAIHDCPDCDLHRERRHGLWVWPEALAEWFEPAELLWLGQAIYEMSILPFRRDGSSG